MRKLFLTLLALSACLFTYAQCDDPAPPGVTCPTALAFCNGEIDGYCSATYASGVGTNVSMPPFCGSVQNNQWIQFVAGTTSISLEFTVTNCLNGDGLQAMILHSDDCMNFTAASNCYTASTSGGGSGTTVFTLSGTNFIVGETYYVMIDGWLGDFCEYSIQVTQGSTSLPPIADPAIPSGMATVCPGATGITYTIPGVNYALGYNWTLPAEYSYVVNGNGESIIVDFSSSAADGLICVETYNDCHTSNQVCLPINIQDLPPSNDYGEYCEGGTFYYPTNGMNYTAGNHLITLPNASFLGCDSMIWLTVSENPVQETYLVETICAGDSYNVAGINYTQTDPNIEVTLSSFEGCDSIVHLDLTVLDPVANLQAPDDLNCNNASVLINGALSNADTYFWATTVGNIVNGQGTNLITVDAPGVYNLTVSMTNAGVTCYDNTGVFINIDNQPPDISVNTDNVSCNTGDDGSATVIVNSGSGPYAYNWSNGSNSPTASNLSVGSYQVEVTGSNGCSTLENINISEPDPIIFSTTNTDASCNGETDGVATIMASGGTGTLSYLWSSGGNADTETDLSAGTYSVTITDENACTEETSILIGEPSAFTITSGATDASCNQGQDGSATVTVSGGTGSFSYLWSTNPQQSNATASNLSAGNYTVTVSDSNNCTEEVAVQVSEPSPLSLNVTGDDPNCFTSIDGTASVNVSGGTGPYSYLWSTFPSQTTSSIASLSSGLYTVTVTDDNGCTSEESITLSAPAALTLSTTQQDILCFGENTGTATVMPSGGTPPYTYLWDDGSNQTSDSALNLVAGTYTVTVTDTNSCTQEITVNLTEPATALTISATSTDALCGIDNGSIDLTVNGGVAPYSYTWTNGAGNTEDPSMLAPGVYTVTVTDSNNCTIATDIQVNTPSGLEALVSITDASCFGDTDGSVDIQVNGGIAPYQFNWNIDSNDGNEDFNNVGAGTYNLTVTDFSGCTVVATGTVNEPSDLLASASSTPASCGGNDGTISLSVNGGTVPYDFDWTGLMHDGMQNPVGVSQGAYQVTVTDANNCVVIETVMVDVPDGPEVTMTGQAVDCNGNNTGNIDVSVSGGQVPYTFTWNDPGYNGQEDISNLPTGDYTLTVTDVNSCMSISSFTITEPSALQISISTTLVSCNGGNDGSASVAVSGGNPPYAFNWCNGNNSNNAIGLSAGTCSVEVTDANGCTISADVVITEPDIISANTLITDVDCNGENSGAIDLTVQGGTGNYAFSWSNNLGTTEDPTGISAGNYEVTITDENACSIVVSDLQVVEPQAISITGFTTEETCDAANGSIDLTINGGTGNYSYNWANGLPPTEDLSSLTAGNYEVTVTDENTCTAVADFTVSEPTALAINTIAQNVLCNGENTGSIEVTVSGGTAPYSYHWDNTAQLIEDPQNLFAGAYTVTVTDANACTISSSTIISEPNALQLIASATLAGCNQANGTIDLTVQGGIPPYQYTWNNGAGTVEDPVNLFEGNYEVTVTDNAGCAKVLDIDVENPSGLSASAVGTDVQCFGDASGSIEVSVSGGIAPFNYNWNTGLGNIEDPAGILPGEYIVTVTDANNCTAIAFTAVGQPPLLTMEDQTTEALCGNPNGTINLTIDGGIPPYDYVWDNGLPANEDQNGLSQGTYGVTVTDANNCSLERSIIVSAPEDLAVSFIQTNISCFGESNGSIDLSVSGGTAPMTFLWDNNSGNSEDLENLPAGVYGVEVNDANGCTASVSITLTEPPLLEAFTISAIDVTCNGYENGEIVLDVVGGTPAYTFDWNDNTLDGQQSPGSLSSGDYALTITDLQGCTFTENFVIAEPSPLTLSATITDADCNGAESGSIDLNAAGGTFPYVFDWNNGTSMTEDLIGVSAGQYEVVVSDDQGCTESLFLEINQPDAIALTVADISDYNGYNVSCWDSEDGFVEIESSGGMAPYAYTWNTGDSGPELRNLSAGDYWLTITDTNGCSSENQILLSAPEQLDIIVETIQPTCFDENDGNIFVDFISGGVEPYTYSLDNQGFSPYNEFTHLRSGMYDLLVQDANGCEWSDVVLLSQPEELSIDLGEDIEIQLGDSVQLLPVTNFSLNALESFSWNRTEIQDFAPWVSPTEFTDYLLSVETVDGCTAEDIITVRVRKDRLVYIPNVFSPNNDGFNDYFEIFTGQGVKEIKTFKVYNRWGETMFERTNFMPGDLDNAWDGTYKGKKLNSAVFIYFAEVEFQDGRIEILKGDVTLITR